MMKKIILIIFIITLIAFIPFGVKADQLQKDYEWETDFFAYDIEKHTDGNYYVVGEYGSGLLKIFDDNYNLIYSKQIPDSRYIAAICLDDSNNMYMIYREDNHFFLDPSNNISEEKKANSLAHCHVLKLDSDGNELFDVDLDNANNFSLYGGIEIYNNSLYVLGTRFKMDSYTRTDNDYNINYYNYKRSSSFIKMDLEGNIVKEIPLGEVTKTMEYGFTNDNATMYGGFSIIQPEKERTILFNDGKVYTYKAIEEEIFLGVNSLDLTKINSVEFGTNSFLNDITETNDENYIAAGCIDPKEMDSSQQSKPCPGIIRYSPDGNILSYKVFEGKGEIISLDYKENGYYGIVNLKDINVNGFNNESNGYYLVKFDLDFNIQASTFVSGKWINTFDFNDEGITILNNKGAVKHYYTLLDNKVNVVNDEEKGRLTISEDREYYPGEIVTFNTEVNDGYKLKEIQVIDNEGNRIDLKDENSFIMPSSEVTVTPVFRKLNNKIILISKEETKEAKFEIQDLTSVPANETIKFIITAVDGYTIQDIKITDEYNNEIQYDKTENEYTFKMPDSDVTIDPYYEAIVNNGEDDGDGNNTGKEDDSIIETIKTEVSTIVDKMKNPSTGDRISQIAIIGTLGIMIIIIVTYMKRRSSTKKRNILY